jgi:Zn-dependent M28 family amino/carboxypeptidase
LQPPRAFFLPILLFAVVACSGGDDPAGSSTATVPPTRASSSTPAATPTPKPDAIGSTQPDGERALEDLRVLSVDIGARVAGTPSEIEARDYLAARLESYGYDVTTPQFEFDASFFLPAAIDIDGEPLVGNALQDTTTGTASGRLVAAGDGAPEDVPAVGLNGAIALIERGDLTFGEKAANAEAAGAVAVIIYNNESGQITGSLDRGVSIPVAGIQQADGEALLARIAAGPVRASVTITDNPQTTAYNVVAKPPGVTTCTTVTGGHYDSVPTTGGADDNASGSAAVLETARLVMARKIEGAHCFVLFGAEEFGLFGSRDFVNDLSDTGLNSLRAMINLDVVGLPQELELIGSEDLVRQAGLIADELGLPSRPSFIPTGAGSDHLSFLNAGVPVVFLYRDDTLIHTPEDSIERMSAAALGETAEVAARLLEDLSR